MDGLATYEKKWPREMTQPAHNGGKVPTSAGFSSSGIGGEAKLTAGASGSNTGGSITALAEPSMSGMGGAASLLAGS